MKRGKHGMGRYRERKLHIDVKIGVKLEKQEQGRRQRWREGGEYKVVRK